MVSDTHYYYHSFFSFHLDISHTADFPLILFLKDPHSTVNNTPYILNHFTQHYLLALSRTQHLS